MARDASDFTVPGRQPRAVAMSASLQSPQSRGDVRFAPISPVPPDDDDTLAEGQLFYDINKFAGSEPTRRHRIHPEQIKASSCLCTVTVPVAASIDDHASKVCGRIVQPIEASPDDH
jgi:hypothetical protein